MSADVLRAVRYLKDNRGPIHRNSAAYKRVVAEVRASDNPMSLARQRLRSMLAIREHEQRHSLATIALDLTRQHNGVTTGVLDAVVAELRRGFPGQKLDPLHHQLINGFEQAIFAQTATLEGLIHLIGRLTGIATYDPHRCAWHTYRAR